jgi:osmoprotectant transport system permease protein
MLRAAIVVGAALAVPGVAAAELVIGSKIFTESVILGEVAVQLARDSGEPAQHRRELGGTRVLWSALERGDIDCYAEYSGTLRAEIFAQQSIADDAQLRDALTRSHAWASQPLGFNNTYVLGMRRQRAQQLAI